LLSETAGEQLSEAQVTDILRLRRSFENTDLVVIDWDAALVVDLDGYAEDVLFVLELANIQLEEFRWMDRALDRYPEQAHEVITRYRWWAFEGTAGVLRSLRRLRVDLARLADEVTHHQVHRRLAPGAYTCSPASGSVSISGEPVSSNA
jgi:hypothetical protein